MNLYKIYYGYFTTRVEKINYFYSNLVEDSINSCGYYWHGLQHNEDAYTIDMDRVIHPADWLSLRVYSARRDILVYLRNEKIDEII